MGQQIWNDGEIIVLERVKAPYPKYTISVYDGEESKEVLSMGRTQLELLGCAIKMELER